MRIITADIAPLINKRVDKDDHVGGGIIRDQADNKIKKED